MPDATPRARFFARLRRAYDDGVLVRVVLTEPRGPDPTLRRVTIRPVRLKVGPRLSFVFRHQTRDLTRNLTLEEAEREVAALVGGAFGRAVLLSTQGDLDLVVDASGRARLHSREASLTAVGSTAHDRAKRRLLDPEQAGAYLQPLGILTAEGAVRRGMEHKYRQLERYLEILAGLLGEAGLLERESLEVVDLGSGKGYLTFGLYDWLANVRALRATVRGIEARAELVSKGTDLARAVGFGGLSFEAGRILELDLGRPDVLVALHACDTATDEALFRGVRADATLLVCAPCCHRELRPQLRCGLPGLGEVLRSGLLLERQAELITDGARALALRAAGYRTRVFEFIAAEHTAKNVMIAAVRTGHPDREALVQLAALRQEFGFRHQRLADLLFGGEAPPGELT